MGFFLLGRGREAGELRLISTEVYAGRSEAIEALTKLSGEPGFEHRDAEVFVLDLDTGMPVVLVAPAAPAAPAEEPEVVEETAAQDAEPKADAGVWEAPAESESEAELEPEPEAELEPEPDDEPAEEPDDEPDDLAGALKRAAGALESEGIVAPESIGPAAVAQDVADSAPEPLSVLDQPWLAEIGEAEPEAEPEPEPETEPEAEPEPEPETEPEAEPEPEPESEPTEPEAEAVEPEPEADAAWPWDTATGAEPSTDEPPTTEPAPYVPDPFEEPAIDGGDFLKIQIGDESSTPATVVMGAYAEEPPVEQAEAPQQPAEPASVVAPDTEIDSMLADLGPVETPSLDAPADAAQTVGSDMADLTCEDCVYVNTCPNKEDLDPARCGNFQWRSV